MPPDVNPAHIVNAPDVCLNYQNEGHGTPAAALAVGSEFGIAKKSTIFSLKVMCAWYEPEEHNEDLVVMQATTPTAMLLAFQRIGEIVRGNNLAAKAVVVLPQGKFRVISSPLSLLLVKKKQLINKTIMLD